MSQQVRSKNINSEMTTDTELTAALATKYDASNPLGFETPAELNARDTANKSRGNHTGTQLASTISDFAASVRGTFLSGLSTATNAAILATDNLLTAMGKIQAQITSVIAILTAYNVSTLPVSTGTANAAGASTAHARADHIHETIVSSFRVSSPTVIPITSTTYTLVAGSVITPNIAGTYLADYSSVVQTTSNNVDARTILTKNGIQIAESECVYTGRGGAYDLMMGGTEIVLNGTTDSIDLRAQVSSGTLNMANKRVRLIRIGA